MSWVFDRGFAQRFLKLAAGRNVPDCQVPPPAPGPAPGPEPSRGMPSSGTLPTSSTWKGPSSPQEASVTIKGNSKVLNLWLLFTINPQRDHPRHGGGM